MYDSLLTVLLVLSTHVQGLARDVAYKKSRNRFALGTAGEALYKEKTAGDDSHKMERVALKNSRRCYVQKQQEMNVGWLVGWLVVWLSRAKERRCFVQENRRRFVRKKEREEKAWDASYTKTGDASYKNRRCCVPKQTYGESCGEESCVSGELRWCVRCVSRAEDFFSTSPYFRAQEDFWNLSLKKRDQSAAYR